MKARPLLESQGVYYRAIIMKARLMNRTLGAYHAASYLAFNGFSLETAQRIVRGG